MPDTFGQFLRGKRLEKNQSLRDFCKNFPYDIGYISRIENDILTPPSEEGKLERLASAFGISKDSEEWETFLNLADVSRRQLPKELDEKVLNYLPAFFRKASKKDISENDVNHLIKLIKGD